MTIKDSPVIEDLQEYCQLVEPNSRHKKKRPASESPKKSGAANFQEAHGVALERLNDGYLAYGALQQAAFQQLQRDNFEKAGKMLDACRRFATDNHLVYRKLHVCGSLLKLGREENKHKEAMKKILNTGKDKAKRLQFAKNMHEDNEERGNSSSSSSRADQLKKNKDSVINYSDFLETENENVLNPTAEENLRKNQIILKVALRMCLRKGLSFSASDEEAKIFERGLQMVADDAGGGGGRNMKNKKNSKKKKKSNTSSSNSSSANDDDNDNENNDENYDKNEKDEESLDSDDSDFNNKNDDDEDDDGLELGDLAKALKVSTSGRLLKVSQKNILEQTHSSYNLNPVISETDRFAKALSKPPKDLKPLDVVKFGPLIEEGTRHIAYAKALVSQKLRRLLFILEKFVWRSVLKKLSTRVRKWHRHLTRFHGFVFENAHMLESAVLEGVEVRRFKRTLFQKTILFRAYLGINKYTTDSQTGEGTAHLGWYTSREEYNQCISGSGHQLGGTKKIFDLRDIKGFIFGNCCFRKFENSGPNSALFHQLHPCHCFTIIGRSRDNNKKLSNNNINDNDKSRSIAASSNLRNSSGNNSGKDSRVEQMNVKLRGYSPQCVIVSPGKILWLRVLFSLRKRLERPHFSFAKCINAMWSEARLDYPQRFQSSRSKAVLVG